MLLKSLEFPDSSSIITSLKALARYRAQSDAEVQADAGKKEGAAAALTEARAGTLKALNTQYDALIASLVATSDKQPEPLIITALAGDSVLSLLTDDSSPRDLLIVRFIQGAGSAYKKSSIWSSDRLVTRVSATASYRLVLSNGDVSAAGVIVRDATPVVVKLGED